MNEPQPNPLAIKSGDEIKASKRIDRESLISRQRLDVLFEELKAIEKRQDELQGMIRRLVIQLDHRGIKIPIEKILVP